jgi:DNA-binding MarR family transcriptional regulator
MLTQPSPESPADRQPSLATVLAAAARRLQNRVATLLAAHPDCPLALANRARLAPLTTALSAMPGHLPLSGARLVDLARSAGMTKQAMRQWVNECEAWGLVARHGDLRDARNRWIRYTPTGLAWQHAWHGATRAAEAEIADELGSAVATVVRLGLESYGAAAMEG